VLEFGLEEADQLDCHTGRARDGHGREPVGRKDLLDPPMGDLAAGSRTPVTRHQDAVGVSECEHCGAFGGTDAGPVGGHIPAGFHIHRP
jgi:hypothetical protein